MDLSAGLRDALHLHHIACHVPGDVGQNGEGGQDFFPTI
jgi:hypothetical protein